MLLTLTQKELEQALHNYVNTILNLNEDAQLDIELKAGRGLDGFTAVIDIVAAGTAPRPKTIVPTPAARTEPVVLHLDPANGVDASVVGDTKVDVPVEVKSEQPEATTETQTKTTDTTTSSVRRPLFGNTKKVE
jgi:hypothetical protein